MLSRCRLCPRRCGADRLSGETGFCGAGRDIRIAGAAPHFWEEPCISGTGGAGAVFFSGCALRCVYCQNYKISSEGMGYAVTEEELAEIFLGLERRGAHNIDLVTPTHYAPRIMRALDLARPRGLSLPVVYNCGGYELTETIDALDGYVDIYMPDFKYCDDKTARRLSGAPDYRGIAAAALDRMYEQVGKPVFDGNGIMRRGMIIRHLMLPGHLCETVHIINYIHRRFGDNVYFSLMSQYTPVRRVDIEPALNGVVPPRAYSAAVGLCERLGMENVYIQDGASASESFIPEFSGKFPEG